MPSKSLFNGNTRSPSNDHGDGDGSGDTTMSTSRSQSVVVSNKDGASVRQKMRVWYSQWRPSKNAKYAPQCRSQNISAMKEPSDIIHESGKDPLMSLNDIGNSFKEYRLNFKDNRGKIRPLAMPKVLMFLRKDNDNININNKEAEEKEQKQANEKSGQSGKMEIDDDEEDDDIDILTGNEKKKKEKEKENERDETKTVKERGREKVYFQWKLLQFDETERERKKIFYGVERRKVNYKLKNFRNPGLKFGEGKFDANSENGFNLIDYDYESDDSEMDDNDGKIDDNIEGEYIGESGDDFTSSDDAEFEYDSQDDNGEDEDDDDDDDDVEEDEDMEEVVRHLNQHSVIKDDTNGNDKNKSSEANEGQDSRAKRKMRRRREKTDKKSSFVVAQDDEEFGDKDIFAQRERRRKNKKLSSFPYKLPNNRKRGDKYDAPIIVKMPRMVPYLILLESGNDNKNGNSNDNSNNGDTKTHCLNSS